MYVFILLAGLLSLKSFAGAEEACSFNKGNCPVRHGYVQDYGYGGFTAGALTGLKIATNPVGTVISGIPNPECVANPMTPVTTGAATKVNGNADDSSKAELEAIQCAGEAGKGYSFSGDFQAFLKAGTNLDELQEELVFLTATEDIHHFNECQNGLYESLAKDPAKKRDLLENAWRQFQDLRSQSDVSSKIRTELYKRSDIVIADSFTKSTRDTGRLPTARDIGRIRDRDQNQKDVEKLRPEINLLLSRIPLANRDAMRTRLENLFLQNTPATEAQFKESYEAGVNQLNADLQKSRNFIKNITVMSGEKRLFCVDRDLKENLYRSGQLDHTIKRLGVEDALTQFKLRSQNRYGLAGTVVTEVALIPTYFAGYGMARLALHAGASSVRAVSMGGRALASSTRLAMLGLEAADYGAAIAHALNDCDSDEFRARVDGASCDPNQELGMAYEEASLAQCITSAALPFASAFVGAGVRIVASKRLDELYNSSRPGQEIVVTGIRPRPERSRVLGKTKTAAELAPYSALRARIDNLGSGESIKVVEKIRKPEEIPFELSSQFRPVGADVMRTRAKELDPEISKAITGAYNALNDRSGLRNYFKELYTDAALWMKHKGRPEDLEALKNGVVTEHAVSVVLVRRAKDRGETDFTTILFEENGKGQTFVAGKLPTEADLQENGNKAFRFAVKSGPFFDKNFTPNSEGDHGVLSHMIQREIVTSAVARATKGNPQKFWDFLGTPKGINFWADLFDSGNDNSLTKPEEITSFMVPALFNK